MRLHPSDEFLDHGHVGIGEFALSVGVAGIERHAQVIQVLLVNAHLDDFVVHIEYIASPRLDDKTLVIVDPMLATGSSMELAYQALVTKGHPAHIHVASVVATPKAIEVVRQHLPDEKTTLWTCDIDDELNEHSYIVPGLGDCGDLLYGEKE